MNTRRRRKEDDEVEEEKEELDEVNEDTKDEGVFVSPDSCSVVFLITALTVFLSQRSGLSFNIISISNDEGCIGFR